MAEFERTENSNVYSETVDVIPIIIRYRQQNIEWNDKNLANHKSENLIERFSGRHDCYFVNKGQDRKGNLVIQIMFSGMDYNVKVSPAKEGRNFYNPIFAEEKFVLPVDEKEYISKTCNILFIKDDVDLIDQLDKLGWLNRTTELKDFIVSCCKLKRPLKELRMEEDRQIWQAYIEGLNALNDAKKELSKIKRFGKIKKEKDNRGRAINTITIDLDTENISENLKEDISDLFVSQFDTAPTVSINQKFIKIEYNSYRTISEDLLAELEELIRENCYVVSLNQPRYELSGRISLKAKREDYELAKTKIKNELSTFGAVFTQNEDGDFVFSNDEDSLFINKLVAKNYNNCIAINTSSTLLAKFMSTDNENRYNEYISKIQKIASVKSAFERGGFIIVETVEPLQLNDGVLASLDFSSCRVKLTPNNYNDDVIVLDTLIKKDKSYFATINDSRKVSIQPNGWKHSIINAYKKVGIKSWVSMTLFYAFRVGVDKTLIRPLQLRFLDHDNIHVNSVKGEVTITAESSEQYLEFQTEINNALPKELSVVYPEYRVICQLSFLTDNVSTRENIFSAIRNSLSDIKFNRFGHEKNDVSSVSFSISFSSEDEREHYIRSINEAVKDFNHVAELSFDSIQGNTSISCILDEVLLDERNKRISYDFNSETINYVGPKYDSIREDLESKRGDESHDEDDEDDDYDEFAQQKFESLVRIEQAKFKRAAENIGTCMSRTPEHVKIRLSDSFIEKIQDKEITLSGGYLQFPVIGSSMELSRQRNAMNKITNPGGLVGGRWLIGYPANRNLPNFLFDPRYADDTEADISEEKEKVASNVIERGLNDKQLEAVTKAILAKDMAFIQGPPGTGKTTVIAEIIWQEILRKPDARILLTSQTNLAVDNALERLQGKRGIRPVRIVPQSKMDKLEREGKRYLLPLIESWKEKATEDVADNAVNLWIDTIRQSINQSTKYAEVLAQWKKDLETKDDYIRQTFSQNYKSKVNLVAATCSICGSKDFLSTYHSIYGTENEPYFDVVIMDEASKATPLEMAVPMVLGKKIIVIGDHKQLPPMMDENSIDTALKKIGRSDLAEKLENIKESQFKRLFEAAQKVRTKLVATLDTQYRMHEQIMQTINHFYKDDLINGLQCGIKETMNNPDMRNKGSRYHGLDFQNIFRPETHAIWINVHNPEKKEGSSYVNTAEQEAIRLVLQALEKSNGYSEYVESFNRPEDKEIGLITFYAAQKRAIKDLAKKGLLGKGSIRIDVVDKFQGMERNIVIVSTVRSNKRKKMGFADRIERINVAFSRAKRLLIVVGDKQFFESNENYRKSISSMEVVDIKQLRDALS